MKTETRLALKTERVINSCNTVEQLDVALNFAYLAIERVGGDIFQRLLLRQEYLNLVFRKQLKLLKGE